MIADPVLLFAASAVTVAARFSESGANLQGFGSAFLILTHILDKIYKRLVYLNKARMER